MQSSRLRRTLQMVFLLEREPRSVSDLQVLLKASRRTVFRDLDLITKAGFRIERVPLRGYQISGASFLGPGPIEHPKGEHVVAIRIPKDTADLVRPVIWHPSQIIEEQADGGVIFRAQLNDLADVAGWAMQFEGAEVIRPLELRAMVYRLSGLLMKANSRGR
jgi:biotin operon repressor